MQKKYYIGVDGGGTKLLAVLFDEDFNLISNSKSGSVNPGFTAAEDIKNNFNECIDDLLYGIEIQFIEHIFISMPGPGNLFIEMLRKKVAVKECTMLSEGYACLTAGIQKTSGIIALSGTGSGVFYQEGLKTVHHIGGWGALFGDEGSGYDIGAAGLRSAQFSFDGRGIHSIIGDLIIEEFKFKSLYEIVSKVYSVRDYRSVICKVCIIVCRAASMGDEAAVSIMEKAGCDMGLQTVTLIDKYNLSPENPIVVSGSVWKYNPYMYNKFVGYINDYNSKFKIYKPKFEPVIGGAAHLAIENNKIDFLIKNFKNFIYEKEGSL